MILRGWKGMTKFAGVGTRTLKRWHYEKERIPFIKDSPGKGGKIWIEQGIFHRYLLRVFKNGTISFTRQPTFFTPQKK